MDNRSKTKKGLRQTKSARVSRKEWEDENEMAVSEGDLENIDTPDTNKIDASNGDVNLQVLRNVGVIRTSRYPDVPHVDMEDASLSIEESKISNDERKRMNK